MIQFASTPQMVPFIPAQWLELATHSTLIIHSRPIDARYLHPLRRESDQWQPAKLSAEQSADLLKSSAKKTTISSPIGNGANITILQRVENSMFTYIAVCLIAWVCWIRHQLAA